MNLNSKSIQTILSSQYATIQFQDIYGLTVSTINNGSTQSLNLNNNSINSLLSLLPLTKMKLISLSLSNNPIMSSSNTVLSILIYLIPTLKYFNGELIPRKRIKRIEKCEKNFKDLVGLQILMRRIRLNKELLRCEQISGSLEIMKKYQLEIELNQNDKINLIHDIILLMDEDRSLEQGLIRFEQKQQKIIFDLQLNIQQEVIYILFDSFKFSYQFTLKNSSVYLNRSQERVNQQQSSFYKKQLTERSSSRSSKEQIPPLVRLNSANKNQCIERLSKQLKQNQFQLKQMENQLQEERQKYNQVVKEKRVIIENVEGLLKEQEQLNGDIGMIRKQIERGDSDFIIEFKDRWIMNRIFRLVKESCHKMRLVSKQIDKMNKRIQRRYLDIWVRDRMIRKRLQQMNEVNGMRQQQKCWMYWKQYQFKAQALRRLQEKQQLMSCRNVFRQLIRYKNQKLRNKQIVNTYWRSDNNRLRSRIFRGWLHYTLDRRDSQQIGIHHYQNQLMKRVFANLLIMPSYNSAIKFRNNLLLRRVIEILRYNQIINQVAQQKQMLFNKRSYLRRLNYYFKQFKQNIKNQRQKNRIKECKVQGIILSNRQFRTKCKYMMKWIIAYNTVLKQQREHAQISQQVIQQSFDELINQNNNQHEQEKIELYNKLEYYLEQLANLESLHQTDQDKLAHYQTQIIDLNITKQHLVHLLQSNEHSFSPSQSRYSTDTILSNKSKLFKDPIQYSKTRY